MENKNGEIRYKIEKIESILNDSYNDLASIVAVRGAIAAAGIAILVANPSMYPVMSGTVLGVTTVNICAIAQKLAEMLGNKKVKKEIEKLKAQGADTMDRDSAMNIEEKANVNLFDALDIDHIIEEGGKRK